MTDFLISELDDRLEFGVVIIDDDQVLNNSGCINDGNCCDKNTEGCSNSSNCGCKPACS
jgi:hypothetical protein